MLWSVCVEQEIVSHLWAAHQAVTAPEEAAVQTKPSRASWSRPVERCRRSSRPCWRWRCAAGRPPASVSPCRTPPRLSRPPHRPSSNRKTVCPIPPAALRRPWASCPPPSSSKTSSARWSRRSARQVRISTSTGPLSMARSWWAWAAPLTPSPPCLHRCPPLRPRDMRPCLVPGHGWRTETVPWTPRKRPPLRTNPCWDGRWRSRWSRTRRSAESRPAEEDGCRTTPPTSPEPWSPPSRRWPRSSTRCTCTARWTPSNSPGRWRRNWPRAGSARGSSERRWALQQC